MLPRRHAFVALAALALLPAPRAAHAQPRRIRCCDGTWTTARACAARPRACCAGRGGVCTGGDPPALASDEVLRVIHAHQRDIQRCYEYGLATHRDLAGRVTVRIVIAGDGAVREAAAVETTLPPAVTECVLIAVRLWRFPAPDGGAEVAVRYPFSFQRTQPGG